jgi:two-component SAPR family response regulator
MHIIKRLITVACCICTSYAYADESPGGLLFTSSKEKVDKRTSLVLFGDKLQKFEDTFSLSFDLSIWDSSQFGHIFRVINKQKQEIEFVFVNFYGFDTMYLDFHSPITHKSVQIPIAKEDIDKKETLHLDILFDLKEDKASITLRDVVYTCEPVGLENPSLLQFAFGLYGLNLDVPQMLIKNLHIRAEKGKSYFFPLEESDGKFAYDQTGKVKAHVKNSEWIVNKHFHWQAKSKFSFKDKAGVVYDDANSRILIVNNDAVTAYYPRYGKVEKYNSGIAFSGFDVSDSVYNPASGKESSLHHNRFFSSSGDLYQFGGYCNHAYSNKISCYNKETQEWEAVDFKGDRIMPRFYSAIGDGVGPDEKLLFGGFGNETGKQEHGGHNLYDLHVLNLKQKTITRLWSFQEVPKMQFIPGSDLILSKDKKHFYALCYAHHIPKTAACLYRFDLQNRTYDVMSDSIRFASEDMNTSVNLFYNKQMNEFYAVIREFSDKNETHVQIYSLLSPPITKSYLEASAHSHRSYGWIGIMAAGFVVCVAGAYILWRFFFRKKKETRRTEQTEILHSPLEDKYDRKVQKQLAVYIFGNFTVYDNTGKDISYRFSPKLKAFFSLVLLHSNGETGISTEELTSKMWPDKDVNEAKNIRGVTVNRLRNILEDIEGISLVHQNHRWFFVFAPSFYCDYLEYSNILHHLHHSSDQKSYAAFMEQLAAIVGNGAFLLSVHDPGMDAYKSKEEEKLGKLLKEYILYLYEDKQYQKVISVSPTFFAIEALNQEILDVCIKSYHKLGKKEEAKVFLKNYKRTYEMLTGEEYDGKTPAPVRDDGA